MDGVVHTGCLWTLPVVFLVLGGSAAGFASAENTGDSTGFGRFSKPLTRCTVSTSGHQHQGERCGVLRLEQNLEGILSVRFSLDDSQGHFRDRDLVFAGMLSPDSHPMTCSQDGRCTPQFPVQLQVQAMASGVYDSKGMAAGLPRAWLARGQCIVGSKKARCEAVDNQGARWSAEGFF